MQTQTTTRPDTRTAYATLAAAGLLGILGDILFQDVEALGINVLLWVGALALALRYAGRHAETPPGQGRWLLVAIGFASCFAIRDAEFLQALNFLAILTALALPSLPWLVPDQRRARLRDFAAAALRTVGLGAFGPAILALKDTDWSGLPLQQTRRAGPMILGLVLVVPIVLVFGSLFSHADPTFANFASALFDWDLGPLFTRVVLTGVFAWIAAGLLRGWLWKPTGLGIDLGIQGPPTIRAIPVGMAVGAMALMFLVFVAIQVRYLFGGAEFVQSVPGFGYAEYARSGFFELVAASGLAVPVLYAADVVVDRTSERAVQNIRRLGSLQIVLIAAVMVSALNRMRLYVDAYGLTQDRIVATAVLVWIGFAIVWFANTVLRGRRERFPFGALTSGFAVLAALNAVNPDLLIARVNVARAEAGGAPLDGGYLANLGADATPFVISHLDALPADERCRVAEAIRQRLEEPRRQVADTRTWNLARNRAARVSLPPIASGVEACSGGR